MRLFLSFFHCSVFCFLINMSYAQELHVEPYKGTVYKVKSKKKYWKFNEDYKDFPVIGTLEWNEINVPSRDVEDGFPDVPSAYAFGIMFNTTFEATKTGMYEFNLTSDDGSILWIDGREVVNNDEEGAMHLKTDTTLITEGIHEMQIWYVQAYPTKLGFIFDHQRVEIPLDLDIDEFSFDSDILFDSNKYELNSDGMTDIMKLVDLLKGYPKVTIRIFGHCDNIGGQEYNLELSEKRALSLQSFLMSELRGKGMKFITIGKGDSMPIADNDTEEGRSKNRRVTVQIEYDEIE